MTNNIDVGKKLNGIHNIGKNLIKNPDFLKLLNIPTKMLESINGQKTIQYTGLNIK